MKDSPSYFAIIPANVRYCKSLEPNAKLLYGEITALTHKEGYCWASNAFFAELYDVDERTIKRWIASLHELGFIKVEVKKDGLKWDRKIWIQNIFTKGQKCPDENTQQETIENDPTDGFQRRDKNVPIEGTKMSPEYYIANIQEKQQQQAAVSSVHACLLNVEIPDTDKLWLSKHHSQEAVADALKWALHPATKINTSLAAAIKWACVEKPSLPRDPLQEAQTNHSWAKAFETNLSTAGRSGIMAYTEYIEINPTGGMHPVFIYYKEKNFKDLVQNELRKRGLL